MNCRYTLTRAAVLAVVAAPLSTAIAAAAQPPAQLIVVHGIPGQDVGLPKTPKLPVDVLVNGKTCLLKGLTFGSIVGPVSLPAGRYRLAVSLANKAKPCGNSPIINATADLSPGTLSAAVAALAPNNKPTLDLFPVQNASIPEGTVNFLNANATNTRVTFSERDVGGNGYDLVLRSGQFDNTKDFGPSGGYAVTLKVGRREFGPFRFQQQAHGEALLFAVGSPRSGTAQVLIRTLQFK